MVYLLLLLLFVCCLFVVICFCFSCVCVLLSLVVIFILFYFLGEGGKIGLVIGSVIRVCISSPSQPVSLCYTS